MGANRGANMRPLPKKPLAMQERVLLQWWSRRQCDRRTEKRLGKRKTGELSRKRETGAQPQKRTMSAGGISRGQPPQSVQRRTQKSAAVPTVLRASSSSLPSWNSSSATRPSSRWRELSRSYYRTATGRRYTPRERCRIPWRRHGWSSRTSWGTSGRSQQTRCSLWRCRSPRSAHTRPSWRGRRYSGRRRKALTWKTSSEWWGRQTRPSSLICRRRKQRRWVPSRKRFRGRRKSTPEFSGEASSEKMSESGLDGHLGVATSKEPRLLVATPCSSWQLRLSLTKLSFLRAKTSRGFGRRTYHRDSGRPSWTCHGGSVRTGKLVPMTLATD
mmetsp:Transcript_35069/g.104650  ORF Transcript_35069/g.104650 Transcript_35069/m.104650 type:complete len:329 (-) Transcript_35069:1017-2003(-)